ncbi:Chloride channel core [Chloroherpeton thalassium ATCC 35110]|uniref:Chloride channel core n=1 Tax=Chloroherpeton thalassium (strain ATCC 35110 / GB-78) TaxID=517418 RepID=B3QW47_CHLT3|nr:chloride channel protein [Chloroherpeton thalassium]ACF14701.1 Chloride channel core [Chloroherpeton thalassium ATCC 35110]
MWRFSNQNKAWKRKALVLLLQFYRKTRNFGIFAPEFIKLTLQKFLISLNLNQDVPFLFVAIAVGWGTGLIAVIFHDLIDFVHFIFFGSLKGSFELTGLGEYWMFLIPILPAAGGLIVGLYNTYIAKSKPGHGLAAVIKAVAQNEGKLPRWDWLHRTFTSVISIGTGGGGGREAPIAQVGAIIGSMVGQILRFSPDRMRTLLGCGAAAGLASVFNAPIGGVMFAIEVILGDFTVKTFSPIVVASVIGTVVSRSFLGNSPTFQSPDYTLVSNIELIFYFILGVLSGFSAVAFIKVFYIIEEKFIELRERHTLPPWAIPAIGGLLTGVIGIWFPGVFGYTYEVIDKAVKGTESWTNLIGVYVFKPITAGLTIGSGGSGGTFAPAMKMGAMLGGMFGSLVHFIFPTFTATSGAYALVGMGAVTAGVMRAPLTVILILFEVTGKYEIVLPIMFAAVTATLIARVSYRHSMETYVLEKEGVRVGYGIALSVAENISILEVLRTNFVQFSEVTRAEKIINIFHNTSDTTYFVTNEAGGFRGVITLDEMRLLLSEGMIAGLIAEDFCNKEVPVLYETSRLDEALKYFEIGDYDALPVVSKKTNKLIGIVKHDTAFAYYRRQLKFYSEDGTSFK